MAAGHDIPVGRSTQGRLPTAKVCQLSWRLFGGVGDSGIGSHARPDGDAVGSMLACGMMLAQLGKQGDLYPADPVPQIYRWLPGATTIRHSQQVEGDYDAVILLECDGTQRSRLTGLEGRLLVNIDHHATGRAFADVNWIENDACAVAEMVYKLAQAAHAEVSPAMATCLYTALLTDTGSSATRAPTSMPSNWRAPWWPAAPIRRGLRARCIFQTLRAKMLLLGAALSNLHREGRLAWLWVTHADMVRTGAAEEDCEGIVNYAIGIAGVEAAVLSRELPDRRVRLSLRSKGRLDVARIAASFGGGGHRHAGGCTVEGPLAAATERILEMMRRELTTVGAGPDQCDGTRRESVSLTRNRGRDFEAIQNQ